MKIKKNNFFLILFLFISATIIISCTEIKTYTPSDNLTYCYSNANQLIPKHFYFISTNSYYFGGNDSSWNFDAKPLDWNILKTQTIKNYWNDGTYINMKIYDDWQKTCLRKGSNPGENINYYYWGCQYAFNYKNELQYERMISDENGYVRGYINFSIYGMIFKKEENNFNFNESIEGSMYKASWNGFTDNIKSLYKTDSLNITIMIRDWGGERTLCTKEIKDIEGSFECDLPKDLAINTGLYSIISPNIIDNQVYEIIDYKIRYCNWPN